MSSNTIVDAMTRAWINELHAPEILPLDSQLLTDFNESITTQESHLVMDDQQSLTEIDRELLRVYRYEIDRQRYMLAHYLAKRIEKIEKHWTILYRQYLQSESSQPDGSAEDNQWNRLTPAEQEFLLGFVHTLEQHFHNSMLQFIHDPSLQLFSVLPDSTTDCVPVAKESVPLDNEMVFLKPLEDIGTFMISDDGTTIDFQKGSLYYLKYKFIRELLQNGQVELI
ncbi:hypothetical protein P9112_001905 [Eukaryota sp. TZLM1-RC]